MNKKGKIQRDIIKFVLLKRTWMEVAQDRQIVIETHRKIWPKTDRNKKTQFMQLTTTQLGQGFHGGGGGGGGSPSPVHPHCASFVQPPLQGPQPQQSWGRRVERPRQDPLVCKISSPLQHPNPLSIDLKFNGFKRYHFLGYQRNGQ